MANVDLNDPRYNLDRIDDPILKFNMFIEKWCDDYSHLIDTDDNDGQAIREMINNLLRPQENVVFTARGTEGNFVSYSVSPEGAKNKELVKAAVEKLVEIYKRGE